MLCPPFTARHRIVVPGEIVRTAGVQTYRVPLKTARTPTVTALAGPEEPSTIAAANASATIRVTMRRPVSWGALLGVGG